MNVITVLAPEIIFISTIIYMVKRPTVRGTTRELIHSMIFDISWIMVAVWPLLCVLWHVSQTYTSVFFKILFYVTFLLSILIMSFDIRTVHRNFYRYKLRVLNRPNTHNTARRT